MSVPDELVRAAAEALHKAIGGDEYCVCRDECQPYARIALAAAFAKLPECEEAVETLARSFAGENNEPDAYDRDDAKRHLAALAKWGQS